MNERLQEYCDSRGVPVRVDRQASAILGVKVLGLESRNGRTYLRDALVQSVALYEGAKVNVNHPPGNPLAARDYRDRIGILRNARVQATSGLFGDLHFNPKHVLAEQLLWDAEHAPESVGLSHNIEARVARRDGVTIIEAITSVHSVDLVADPATTHGLFEAAESGAVIDTRGNDAAALRWEVDRLHAQQAAVERLSLIRKLLEEFGLPAPNAGDSFANAVTSEVFVETLLAARDERALRRLIEERARLIGAVRDRDYRPAAYRALPQSREQGLAVMDARSDSSLEEFVRAIR